MEKEIKNTIAFCGLDCEKCDAYTSTQNNDQGLEELKGVNVFQLKR